MTRKLVASYSTISSLLILIGFTVSCSASDGNYPRSNHHPNHQHHASSQYQAETSENEKHSAEWNRLIFTQTWGYSECLEFKDKHHSNGVTCRNENLPSVWVIHGIWPSRGNTLGPNFCTNVKYDGSELESIRPLLNKYWFEIDGNKGGDHFWSHEWIKHGSCAREIPIFGSELKYFSEALKLREKFDLFKILEENKVIPQTSLNNSGYPVTQIFDSFTKSMGPAAIPNIQCLGRKVRENVASQADPQGQTHSMEDYILLEIQLCLNKDLQLTPCSSNGNHAPKKVSAQTYHLPCPTHAPIKYVDPNYGINQERNDFK